MYGALLYGGKLLLIPKMTVRDPQKYLDILKTEKVTILNQTPGAFYQLAQQELNSPGKNLRLKYVIFGGEALIPAKLKPWKEKYPGIKLINMFGITETTVHVTFKEIEDKDIQLNISNIGTPLPTLNTYVMDKHQKLMPIGVAGELCVSGEGVCRGYLNRPELTKEKFLTDSHPAGKSKRLYRSGDLGKFTINGELEYLGRIDHQVKIRGYRIELAEIESQLLDHAEIKEAVVVANEEKNLEKYLCTYIVPVEPDAVNASELRKYLLEKLPEYMVPGHFVNIEKIPLTANGKVDRKALERYGTKLDTGVEYAAPRNKLEKIVADTWKKVLKLEKVSIHDNFFDLGGNSLSIIRINHQLNEVLEKELSIVAMFEYPTIESLSVYLTQTETRENSKEKEIEQFDELNDDAFNMMEQTLGIIGKSKDE
jgi:acyl-coenzyme A synthetase/AMP-(fatty) acid ligase